MYDRLMDDVDYAAWARYYIAIIEKFGKKPNSIFESACGTGSLTAELAQYGFKLVAADLSQDMLEVAREKLRRRGARVPLVCQDMRKLEVGNRVDAVIACCDGVNYLTDDKSAHDFAQHAFCALRPGGVLAFDVSTTEKLRAMDGQTYCDEREDIAAIWKNSFDEASACLTMEVSLYVSESNGLYRRMEEVHVQRARSIDEITNILQEAGFADIRAYGDRTFEQAQTGDMRVHFAARKP